MNKKKPEPSRSLVSPAFWFSTKPVIQPYRLFSSKRKSPLRLALVSDLHNFRFGPYGEELAALLKPQRPDAVCFCGDMADDKNGHRNAFGLLRHLGTQYACFYILGNHETRRKQNQLYRSACARFNIVYLENEQTTLYIAGEPVQFLGLADPEGGHGKQLLSCVRLAKERNPDCLSVLLAHRPEFGPFHATFGYDLILSGHAHGGQWRFPGAKCGFFAPGQGFLPRHAGGVSVFPSGSQLVVGRGLAKTKIGIPRICNPPEIVIIDVFPK